jgi:L-ascorbate metabolism protein UlaG (beta-lactamase superfamily)
MFKSSIIAAVFTVGLLTSGAQAQDAKSVPDLKGTWEAAAGQVHHKVHGHKKDQGSISKIVVLSQEGRVFHGTVGWNTEKVPGKDSFSGVIDKDGVTFYVAGHTDGIRIGKLEGADAFTFYILQPGGANPRAGFAEYKRVK